MIQDKDTRVVECTCHSWREFSAAHGVRTIPLNDGKPGGDGKVHVLLDTISGNYEVNGESNVFGESGKSLVAARRDLIERVKGSTLVIGERPGYARQIVEVPSQWNHSKRPTKCGQ